MELKDKKSGSAADSTNEAALSGNDVAGREAALSFSGEDMTKAAAKRHALMPSTFPTEKLSDIEPECHPQDYDLPAQCLPRSCPDLASHGVSVSGQHG